MDQPPYTDHLTRPVADLIQGAEHASISQLEDTVRGLRTVEHNETTTAAAAAGEPRPAPQEYVRHTWTAASQSRLTARLDPERGAVVQSALDQLARAEGLSPADALVRLAEIGLAALADRDTTPPRGLRGDERAAVVIHLTTTDLAAEGAAGRIAGGPGLPARVIKRLLCAGRIRTAIHDTVGNVRDLGRSHRLVTDRQYRALLLRDHNCCSYPGCESTRSLEAHHVKHWIHGGRTDLTNLILLCPRHHHTHHDGHYHIKPAGNGRFTFTRTDGTTVAEHINPAEHIHTHTPLENEHPHVTATAATTHWNGDPLDLHWAVAVLTQRRHDHRVGLAQDRDAATVRLM